MSHPTNRIRSAAVLAIAGAVVGCGSGTPTGPATTSPGAATTTLAADPATDTVGADGATVTTEIGGMKVTASAPADVAASGTPFRISATSGAGQPFDAQVGSSDVVRLELGSNQQPRAPITLTFNLAQQTKLTGLMSDTVRPLVRSVSDGDPATSDYAEAEWDPDTKTLSATTDHLSDFQVIFADIGKAVSDAVEKWTFSAGPVGPECADGADEALTIGETRYTLTSSKPDAPVTGCLNDEGGVGIKFDNASEQYYGIVSDPAGEYSNSGAVSSDDMIATWLRKELDGAGLLIPKGAGQVTLCLLYTSPSPRDRS